MNPSVECRLEKSMRATAGGWIRTVSIIGFLGRLVALVLMAQASLIAGRLNAATLDPAFCSPASLHTTVELPETQLTRDFMAIRILLKDPADNFDVIRMLYEGELQAPDLRLPAAWLSK